MGVTQALNMKSCNTIKYQSYTKTLKVDRIGKDRNGHVQYTHFLQGKNTVPETDKMACENSIASELMSIISPYNYR